MEPEAKLDGLPEHTLDRICTVCGSVAGYFAYEDWVKAPDLCLVHMPGMRELTADEFIAEMGRKPS